MKLLAGICATALLVYAAPAWAERNDNGKGKDAQQQSNEQHESHHENGDNENKGQSATGACASAYGQSRAEEAHAQHRDVKSKGKKKGEKGGTEDINIGIGELQEDCGEYGVQGEKKKSEHGDDHDDGHEGKNEEEYDGKVGVGDLQECIAEAMAGGNLQNAKETCQDRLKEEAKTRAENPGGKDEEEEEDD